MPGILEKTGTGLRASARWVAEGTDIPIARFAKGDRTIEVMRRFLAGQEKTGRSEAAAVGAAHEGQNMVAATARPGSNGVPWLRLPRPLIATDRPPAPVEIRHALATIDRHVSARIAASRLGNTA